MTAVPAPSVTLSQALELGQVSGILLMAFCGMWAVPRTRLAPSASESTDRR